MAASPSTFAVVVQSMAIRTEGGMDRYLPNTRTRNISIRYAGISRFIQIRLSAFVCIFLCTKKKKPRTDARGFQPKWNKHNHVFHFCPLFVFHFPVYAPVAPVVEFIAHDAERLAAVAFCAPVPRNVGEVLP